MADVPAFPHIIQNGPGNLPDADQVMDNLDTLRDYLNENDMELEDLAPATSGQIVVADGSGALQPVTPSGDVAVSAAGELTANQQQAYGDAAERTTTSGSFVQLAGALQGSVTFGASGGIIFVMYRALWKLVGSTGNTAEAQASIHIGGTALDHTFISHGQSAYIRLISSPILSGIATTGNYSGLQAHGGNPDAISLPEIHGSITTEYGPDLIIQWAAVPVEVAAGTHTVDVRYKLGGTDGGTVTVKDRRLAIWALAF